MNKDEIINTKTILKNHFHEKKFEDLLTFNVPKTLPVHEALDDELDNIMDDSIPEKPKIDEEMIRLIIEGCESLMKKYGRDITYTQLRNILQIVKDEDFKKDRTDLLLAIPKLAYLEGRPQKGKQGPSVIRFIRELAWEVRSKKKYEAFEEIMSTLVAYHKIHGSKN